MRRELDDLEELEEELEALEESREEDSQPYNQPSYEPTTIRKSSSVVVMFLSVSGEVVCIDRAVKSGQISSNQPILLRFDECLRAFYLCFRMFQVDGARNFAPIELAGRTAFPINFMLYTKNSYFHREN